MKNFLYRLFYKKNAEKTIMAIENCKAYNDYKNSYNQYYKISKYNLQLAITNIDYECEQAVNNGYFYCISDLPSRINKESKKYLKKYYLDKGYKVRFKCSENLFEKDLIKLSWKHWR